MNKTFLQVNDSVVQSGTLHLNIGLAAQLKQANETFANLVKLANERALDSDEEEFGDAAPAKKTNIDVASTAAQAEPSQLITPPKKEQPWGFLSKAQTTEHLQSGAAASQPPSYLEHISSASYSLPDPRSQSSVVRRNLFSVGEVLDQSRSMSAPYQLQPTDEQAQQQEQQQQQQQQSQPLPFGLVDLPSREQSPFVPPYIFPVNVPAIGAELPPPHHQTLKAAYYSGASTLATRTLSPGYTYSYDEITFARRLMRATLEAGFLLLSNPDIPPAMLNYIYKLSLPYLTLDEIRTRFKTILSRGVNEDLDWYATPFLHLGGAGTHYQRRDAQGKPIPMKNTWTIRQIGPLDRRMIRVESVADGQIQDLEGIDLIGFEGEWFDAYDVQGYLEEQWNCRIDPKSSFAECLVEDENAVSSDNETESPSLSRGSTAGISDTATPPIPPTFGSFEPSYGLDMSFNNAPTPNYLPAPPKHNLLDLSFDQTLGLDLAPAFGMGFTGDSGYSTLGLSVMDEAEQLPVVKQKPKKVAWVDVQKLIESKCNCASMIRSSC